MRHISLFMVLSLSWYTCALSYECDRVQVENHDDVFIYEMNQLCIHALYLKLYQLNETLLRRERDAGAGEKQYMYADRGERLLFMIRPCLSLVRTISPEQFRELVKLHAYLYQPVFNELDENSINDLIKATMAKKPQKALEEQRTQREKKSPEDFQKERDEIDAITLFESDLIELSMAIKEHKHMTFAEKKTAIQNLMDACEKDESGNLYHTGKTMVRILQKLQQTRDPIGPKKLTLVAPIPIRPLTTKAKELPWYAGY